MNESAEATTLDLENLIAMNEMIKRTKGKETTFQQMKRQKITSSNRAFIDPEFYQTNCDQNSIETLLDKGAHQPERILAVTTLDDLGLLICYLVRYTNGQLELVPNRTVHRHCPQMVIDFLESNLIFSNNDNNPNLPDDLFKGLENANQDDVQLPKDSKTESQTQTNDNADLDDDDDDFYQFDELSKCFDMKNLTNVINKSTKPQQNETIEIDFAELDDNGSNRSTSQIHKLIINEDDDNPISKPGTSKSIDDQIEPKEISHLQAQEIEFVNTIFDKETIEELLDNNLLDDDQLVMKERDAKHEQTMPGLDEINQTLSMSFHPNDSQEKNDSHELSSISPDIMEQLLRSEVHTSDMDKKPQEEEVMSDDQTDNNF
ncbi:uncharacterized protein LOC113797233 [Dermatophagoides pteronyssinus]|uniref:uncharacterized protein LOC113797233 n=1 Tax=Dermatophagoides pteronyssinus TaxID=6956 RepID=UPI003F665AC0